MVFVGLVNIFVNVMSKDVVGSGMVVGLVGVVGWDLLMFGKIGIIEMYWLVGFVGFINCYVVVNYIYDDFSLLIDLCFGLLCYCGSGDLYGGNELFCIWFVVMKLIVNNFGEV